MVHEIGKFLKENMPSLRAVYNEWPSNNVSLETPSISILTTDPGFQPDIVPYIHEKGPIEGARYEVLYVYGEYNASLQLDLWCKNKEERYRLLDEFKKAMLAQWPERSILLNLENYHNILCRYDFEEYNFNTDNEESSQTNEWRVRIDMLAHCKAIHTQEEFAILQTEINDSDINEIVGIE
jgi:hypothetical protein